MALSRLYITMIVSVLVVSGCKLEESYESDQLVRYQQKNATENLSQVRFIFDSLGSLNLQGLINVNIIPVKVYGTAMLLAEAESDSELQISSRNIPEVMSRYGFLRPEHIANWDKSLAPEPELDQVLGYLTTTIDQKILGERIRIEVGTITCAACHSGWAYDSKGRATHDAWLGAPSTTVDFDSYLAKIYRGLEIASSNESAFLDNIKRAFPEIQDTELATIRRFLMPKVRKTIRNPKLQTALPFPNGGPGITNGIGAFKKDARILVRPKQYHSEEAGFVGVPALWDRGFRSSLTADGAYGSTKTARYYEVSRELSKDPMHLEELSRLASFFSFSAMGNIIDNIPAAMPRAKDIFNFLKGASPQAYPGTVDFAKAREGSKIFARSCSGCHGSYDNEFPHPKLLSFPNKLIPQEVMGTDPTRWRQIDSSVPDFTQTNLISQYVDAGSQLGGYVAPILTGVWSSAPYFHNGSVPTLHALLFSEERPAVFQTGGAHQIDLENVGILLAPTKNNIALYPASFQPRSKTALYRTSELGRSNKGHEKQFKNLSSTEKTEVLEFLKLL